MFAFAPATEISFLFLYDGNNVLVVNLRNEQCRKTVCMSGGGRLFSITERILFGYIVSINIAATPFYKK